MGLGEILARLEEDARNEEVSVSVLEAFALAIYRDSEKWPYALGGGHDPAHRFQPSKDIRAQYENVIGFDCSGSFGDVWNRVQPLPHAMDTEELLSVGLQGEGRFLTGFVIHDPGVIEHCALRFSIPSDPEKRWFMAAHTGTTVGFIPGLPDDWMAPFHYHERRRP